MSPATPCAFVLLFTSFCDFQPVRSALLSARTSRFECRDCFMPESESGDATPYPAAYLGNWDFACCL